MRYRLEHQLPWSGSTRSLIRLLYTDPELSEALADMRHLKRREVTHLQVDEAAGRGQRRVRIELDMAVPDVVRRLLGGASAEALGNHMGWEEHSTCDLDARTIDFAIRLPYLDTRVHAEGTYRLLDDAGGTLRRIDGEVRIDAPVVGRLAERIVVARLKENMDEEARLTAAFLRRHYTEPETTENGGMQE